MSQLLFSPLYRLDLLIEQKVIAENRPRRVIIREIEQILGISDSQFRRIRRAQKGQPGYLSVTQLEALASYFAVPIDALINRTSSSVPAAGPEGTPSPAAFSSASDEE